MAFTLWSNLNPLFANAGGTITGQNWARDMVITRVNSGQGADPVVIDMATPAATFVNNGVNTYNVYMTAQDALGNQQAQTLLVGTATEKLPFQQSAFSIMYTQASGVITGGVMWWAPGTVAGTYDLMYREYTDTPANVTTATPALTLSASAVTLFSGVIPTGYNFGNSIVSGQPSRLIVAYASANGANMDVNYGIFDTAGALVASVTAASNVAAGMSWTIGQDPSGNLYYGQEDTSATRNIVIQHINRDTGALTSYLTLSTNLTDVIALDARWLSTGNFVGIAEGFTGPGTTGHVLEMAEFNTAGVQVGTGFNVTLPGTTSPHWLAQRIANDQTVLIFNNGSAVQLVELDSFGNQVGTTFTVPGITSFDRLRSLGDGRVEITYRLAGAGLNENEVYGVIYDTRSPGQTITGTANSDELAGTVGGDLFVATTGFDRIVGGGGNDAVDYSGLVSTSMTTVLNAYNGQTIKGGANGTDQLTGITDIIGSNTSNVYVLQNGAYQVTTGNGNDIFIVDNSADTIFRSTPGGFSSVLSTASSFTLPTNVSYLQINADNASGSEVNTTGTWILEANGNNDTLNGGVANDIYVVHHANTTITDAGGTNTIISYSDYTVGSNVTGNDILALVSANTTGTGNNAGDVLEAFAANDTLIGGTGNDLFEVTFASDVVQEAPGGGFDVVWSVTSNYVLPTNVEQLQVLLDGGKGTSNAAGGIIVAASHNDILESGTGNDTLFGDGLGVTYLFDGPGFGSDVIGGFTAHSTGSLTPDVVDLSAFALTNGMADLTLTAGLSGGVPITTVKINGDAADQIIFYGVASNQLQASDFKF